MKPITFIETPFVEKFGIPRQPLLVNEAWGRMDFPKNDFFAEAFRGLENFTHLWLIFSFHEALEEGVKALVRPPRFGGDSKWGVFATRSPHRPNHLGLSVVKFKKLELLADKISLWVEGVDLVSGTPIFDIKPYLPYADAVIEAKAGVFQEMPQFKKVEWSCVAPDDEEIRILIEKVIGLDPRPSFDKDESFGVFVAGYNIRFQWQESGFMILECKHTHPEKKI
jgi:tRNA-Thr(GGU) m(6)t(6)A37 methyltransferase TsaA